MRPLCVIWIAAGLLISACGATGTANTPDPTAATEPAAAAGAITVIDPWARPTAGMMNGMHGEGSTSEPMEIGAMAGVNGAVYMSLRNSGGSADRLIKAETDAAQTVELHTSEMNDGVMSMRQVEAIEVPANGEVALAPGGFHVMLLDVTRELQPGDTVDLTLTFENAGTLAVQATVRER